MTIQPMVIFPNRSQLPCFNDTRIDLKALEVLLQSSQKKLDALLTKMLPVDQNGPIDWTPMQVLETIESDIGAFWAPIDHLQSVMQTPSERKPYQTGLSMITQWGTALSHNQSLYQWMQAVKNHPEFSDLSAIQQRMVQYQLNQFRLAGIALSDTDKKRYQAIQIELAKASAQFESNIVDSSQAQAIFVEDIRQLKGLSERVIQAAMEAAGKKSSQGWLFKIDGPTLQAIMSDAEDRDLRKQFYKAWVTRASEMTDFDNSQLMYDILLNRKALSQLTGFNNYAELSLANDKMAESPKAVLQFLESLLNASHSTAQQELETLKAFAKQKGFMEELEPWDISYFSEQLTYERFGIQQEQLRSYFPLTHVLPELFRLLNEQFGLHTEVLPIKGLWDESVQVVEIQDKANQVRGYLYLDLYTRPNKRSGAWVNPYAQRRLDEKNQLHLPMAFLVCNFAPPAPSEPALLTHDDVVTLFHEMGHALHHVLTQINYATFSGMAGVPWDAVELPSQLLEQFPWNAHLLKRLSSHYQTGEPLPDKIVQNLAASHHFQAGLKIVRQLEFSLFDFQLHYEFAPAKGFEQIQTILNQVRSKTAVLPVIDFNRFQHSFAHIFSGGYGAGYYSYLWAEVLAADAFARFLEGGLSEGRLNPTVGQSWVETVLELGGSFDMSELFKAFRGRDPDPKALLAQRGVGSK